jgi:hypothetical protein
MELFKKKYKIVPGNCLGVYYRGTDKYTETELPDPNLYIKAAHKLNYDSILIQTDQQQVLNLFIDNFKNKCIIIEEIPTVSNNIGCHHQQKDNKLQTAIELNSVLRIISECKEVLVNPNSSVSQFIVNLRNKTRYI